MQLSNIKHNEGYLDCVKNLMATKEVGSMRRWRHHIMITTYEHSVFVSYIAFRLARRWNCDCRMAARMGLLHDLYLYDSKSADFGLIKQCFKHPATALENARAITDINSQEENIILSHMWPISTKAPHSKEAWIVNLADKVCSIMEVSCLSRLTWVRQKLPAPCWS